MSWHYVKLTQVYTERHVCGERKSTQGFSRVQLPRGEAYPKSIYCSGLWVLPVLYQSAHLYIYLGIPGNGCPPHRLPRLPAPSQAWELCVRLCVFLLHSLMNPDLIWFILFLLIVMGGEVTPGCTQGSLLLGFRDHSWQLTGLRDHSWLWSGITPDMAWEALLAGLRDHSWWESGITPGGPWGCSV